MHNVHCTATTTPTTTEKEEEEEEDDCCIDEEFINELEGFRTDGYVPMDKNGNVLGNRLVECNK